MSTLSMYMAESMTSSCPTPTVLLDPHDPMECKDRIRNYPIITLGPKDPEDPKLTATPILELGIEAGSVILCQ